MENYYVVIVLALVGFAMLAAALLVPVYLFLKKEERTAERWTDASAANPARPHDGPEAGTKKQEGVVSADGHAGGESRPQ